MECTQVLLSQSSNEDNLTAEKCPVAILAIGGEYYTIYNTENVVGRDTACDVVIDNSAISSRHAIIEAEDPDAHLIYDVGSTNKTKLGKMVLKPHVRYHINDGDYLTFGNVSAQYNISKQYPSSPVKSKPSLNLHSIPESPERPEPTQLLGEIEGNKVKVNSSTLNTSETDLFDEVEAISVDKHKKNVNTSCEADDDIYELDTLTFNDGDIGQPLVPKQNLTESNISTNNNVVEDTPVSDLSVYDICTQEPVASDGKNLSKDFSIYGKDKIKSNYEWEDFPEIASPVGLDTSNADNLDAPKASSSLLDFSSDVLKKKQDTEDGLQSDLCKIDEADSTKQVVDTNKELACRESDSEISERLAHLETNDQPKPEQYPDNDDFYIPMSQNVDMFEDSLGKDKSDSPEEDDVYELLTQVTNENQQLNNPDESIYDLQTQVAIIGNESSLEVTINTKKNDDRLSLEPDILEPATQPFESKENVRRTSLMSVKVIDETDQDVTFSTSMYEAATQPYPQFCEEKSVSSSKVVSNNNLAGNVDSIPAETIVDDICEVATQICPQIVLNRAESKIENLLKGSVADNIASLESKLKEDTSFSMSMMEAATQPCPESTVRRSLLHQHNRNENINDILVENLDETKISTTFCERVSQPIVKSKSSFEEISNKHDQNDKSELSTFEYEAATQPFPRANVDTTQCKQEETKRSEDKLVLDSDRIDQNNIFSTSVFEIATQPCPQEVFSKSNVVAYNTKDGVDENNSFSASMYEAGTQPCPYKSENSSLEGQSVKNGGGLGSGLNEHEQMDDTNEISVLKGTCYEEMSKSFFEVATQPIPEQCRANRHNDTKDEESSGNIIKVVEPVPAYNEPADLEQSPDGINEISSKTESPNISEVQRCDADVEYDLAATQPSCTPTPCQKSNLSGNEKLSNCNTCETELPLLKNNCNEQNADLKIKESGKSKSSSESICEAGKAEIKENISADLESDLTMDKVNFLQEATQPAPCPVIPIHEKMDENIPERTNIEERNTSVNTAWAADVSSTGALKKSLIANTLSDSFFEAATQPYNSSDAAEKTFLDPLTSICDDLSVDKISRISDELLYGNISKNLNETNKKIQLGNSSDSSPKVRQTIDSDNNIYEALNRDSSYSSHDKAIPSKNYDNQTTKMSTQDLKRILESDDLTQKYDEFHQTSPVVTKSHQVLKKDTISLNINDETKETVSKQVLKNSDDSSQELGVRFNKKQSNIFPPASQNFDNDDSSQELNIRSNKKRCSVFPPDTQSFDNENLKNDDSSQELNIRSSKKRCNVFPPDTQNFDNENLKNDDSSQELNIRSSKKRCNVFPPDTQNLKNDELSQELNIKSNKKRCNVFPSDSQDISNEPSQEPAVSVQKPQCELSSHNKELGSNTFENIISNNSNDTSMENNTKSVTYHDDVVKQSTNESEEINSNFDSSGKNAEKGKSVAKPCVKRNSKEMKNKSPSEREPLYISRGNITLHSPEVLTELEEQFRLTKVAMSPTQLSVVSDNDDLNSSQEVCKTPARQEVVRRSGRNKASIPIQKLSGNNQPTTQRKLEPGNLPINDNLLNENKIKTLIDSAPIASQSEKSFKKFKKVSPMKNDTPPNEKDEKPHSVDSSDNSQNSEELGRGKRKRVRTSYEGFILEEDIKRTSRKKLSFSQTDDDGGLNTSVTKPEEPGSKVESVNSLTESPKENTPEYHQSNSSRDPMETIRHQVSVVLHDIQKNPSEVSNLFKGGIDKTKLSKNKKVSSPINEEESCFVSNNKRSNVSINDEVLSKTKKSEIPNKENKNTTFSFSEKLDELFNIWGPADRVKLSPRAAKKSYKLTASGKNENVSASSSPANSKKPAVSTASNKPNANQCKGNTNRNNKSTIAKRLTPPLDIKITSVKNNSSRRKRYGSQKSESSESSSDISELNKKKRKISNSETSENSIDIDTNNEGDSAVRKSSRISKKKIDEVTSKASVSDKISTRSRQATQEKMPSQSVDNEPIANPARNSNRTIEPNISDLADLCRNVRPVKPPLNIKSKNSKRVNKNKEEEPSSSRTADDECIFSQEYSFHEDKIEKVKKISSEVCEPPPVVIRRSSRRKNESTVKKNIEQVMFTGFADKKTKSIVNILGGQIVESPFTCTVLVTDKVRRTTKFLSALSRGLPIVSPKWLTDSKESGRFLDVNEFTLNDKEAEKMFSFNLKKSIDKARNGKMLDGWSVYVTPSVKPSPEEMKSIIECSGGKFLAKEPATRWPTNSLIVSCSEDRPMWNKFTKRGKSPPVIVETEAILSGVLRQELNLEFHRL